MENCIENIVNLNGELSSEILDDSDDIKKELFNISRNNNEIISKNIVEENFNLEDIEKEAIINAIKYNDYNVTKTAKSLGVSRNTLYLKIKKYNIEIKN